MAVYATVVINGSSYGSTPVEVLESGTLDNSVSRGWWFHQWQRWVVACRVRNGWETKNSRREDTTNVPKRGLHMHDFFQRTSSALIQL